ncbi:MAG: sigma-70 family RNA polymerase sigma factor [Solobacterium sp.]|nr:sigma-70 family RNA polymerase sigma factor [Solobacterium sp.]
MINNEKIKYIDGKLKGIKFSANRAVEIWDRLQEISIELKGTVRSPAIRSEEEAKYQRGTRIYKSNIVELMNEEEMLLKQYEMYETELNDIQKFLQKLSDSEIELLHERYECGRTFETIGEIVGYDMAAVQRKIRNILSKY